MSKRMFACVVAAVWIAPIAAGQGASAELSVKLNAKTKRMQALCAAPRVVATINANHTAPPAEASQMTNEKWTALAADNALVVSVAKNDVATVLRNQVDDSISTAFVSGADGGKIGFITKTAAWNHKGNPKHDVPMSGQVYIRAPSTGNASGLQLVQIGLPVLDAGKPPGSTVITYKVAKLSGHFTILGVAISGWQDHNAGSSYR